MTVDEFLQKTEGYYDKYNSVVREIVSQWLRKCTVDLNHLWAELLKLYSARWNKNPGIAELEEAKKRTEERIAIENDATTRLLTYIENITPEEKETGKRLIVGILSALRDKRDPREDEEVKKIVGGEE